MQKNTDIAIHRYLIVFDCFGPFGRSQWSSFKTRPLRPPESPWRPSYDHFSFHVFRIEPLCTGHSKSRRLRTEHSFPSTGPWSESLRLYREHVCKNMVKICVNTWSTIIKQHIRQSLKTIFKNHQTCQQSSKTMVNNRQQLSKTMFNNRQKPWSNIVKNHGRTWSKNGIGA
jgi:hypothetical protein